MSGEFDVPADAPDEVKDRVTRGIRVPSADPTLGIPVPVPAHDGSPPPNRLVTLGDSLTHGFQSGAVFNTALSYSAIIAAELGLGNDFRYPRYDGPGGLPLNLEVLLRTLEARYGPEPSAWEVPGALLTVRGWMDQVEDFWERGPGSRPPAVDAYHHVLGMYGWDLRDTLSRTGSGLTASIGAPRDDLVKQFVQDDSARAAQRVYPLWSDEVRRQTLPDAARSMGEQNGADDGIETLVVFLGATNCLGSVTKLRITWSGDGYQDLDAKGAYTVWRPEHFRTEYDELVRQVEQIRARHVIWCTVPHVTIAPVARGIGDKLRPGSRYYPYYTRPWVTTESFRAAIDPHLTGAEARAVDTVIDLYNEAIEGHVRAGRTAGRSWFLLDVAGMLDRLASRRFIEDPDARPPWWTPYPLPAPIAALEPAVDSHFLTADGNGGRAAGGLFSLDGVHPTTVGYGLVAQELSTIMQSAGVDFRTPDGRPRTGPVQVDFESLLQRDTLVQNPPQLINRTLDTIAWADRTFGVFGRALPI